MSNIHHEDFEKLLDTIKHNLDDVIEFEQIRSIESNFDTKGLMFKVKSGSLSDGTIIVGEDKGVMAVDVSLADGKVVSFVLEDLKDKEGTNNIINWLKEKYS
jgi:hypothetical protein